MYEWNAKPRVSSSADDWRAYLATTPAPLHGQRTPLSLSLSRSLSRRVTSLPRASHLADAFRLPSTISLHKDSAVWRCKSSCKRRNSLMPPPSGKLPPHQHDATSPESRQAKWQFYLVTCRYYSINCYRESCILEFIISKYEIVTCTRLE